MALHIWVSPLTLYFLHFFDVPLLQSLQKLAFNLTSIPAVLEASSLLPLDPPSHGSIALSYPNKLLMRPDLRFHTQTHVRTSTCRHTHACMLMPDQFSGWTLVAVVQNLLPRLSVFYTSHSLPLCFLLPSFHPSLSLWGDKHDCACGFKASGKWDTDTDHKKTWHR